MKPARSGFVPAIDALRGLAALSVAVFHSRIYLWAGWRAIRADPARFSAFDRAAAWLSAPAPFLGSAVMLFFVISGFCVHLPHAGAGQPFVFGPYIRRRFLRIYPPYLGAVLLSGALALGGMPRLGIPATGWERILPSALMVQNYSGGQLATNPSLWSLPVEMELYLVYPLFLFGLRRLGAGKTMAGVALVSAAAAFAYRAGAHWLYGNFAIYWILWCAGAWLAERWRRADLPAPPRLLGAAAAVSLALGLYRDLHHRDSGLTHFSYGLAYFWLVWFLLAHPGFWAAVPGRFAQGLAWLGRVSYSFYLLHFPLFCILGAAWLAQAQAKPGNFLAPLLACVAIAPLVALYYRAVEGPSHRWAKNPPGKENAIA